MDSSPESWQIIAPGLIEHPWNEAEVLGATVWLNLHSDHHRFRPMHSLSNLLIPAIKHRQFLLISSQGQAIFYLSWAQFSAEAELRYVNSPPLALQESDWHSGPRRWIVDWIAPFGHTVAISRLIKQHYFRNSCFRSLYHRGDEKGLRIQSFYGRGLNARQAKQWFNSHPVLLASGQPQSLSMVWDQT